MKYLPVAFLLCALTLLSALRTAAADPLPAWQQRLMPDNDDWKQTDQHYTFNNGAEPETLDPALITGVPEARLAEAIFEGLVTLDPETLQPRPGLASSWEMSGDGLTYTFHIRSDAKWSNGRQITSRDFLLSWKRVLTAATGSYYAYQLYPLVNAEAYYQGKVKDFGEVGVKAPDPATLVVTLHDPCGYFLSLAAFHTLYPVPLDVIAAKGDRWVRPENILCSGPFLLKEWAPRERIELVKNPHYYDRSIVKLTRITAYPYENLDTAYRLFLQGKLHWMDGIPLPKLEEARRNPDFYTAPYLGIYFYRFNCSKPPFNDVRVRKAFSLAVDRRVITQQVTRLGETPATWFTPAMPGYTPPKGLAWNPDEAKRLFREAGYGPGGKEFPKVEILYNTSDAHRQIAETIAQQWKTQLGVTVGLRNSEWKVYLAETNNLNYDIARAAWIGDYQDPNTFLDLFVTDGGNNRCGWSDPAYDALLAKAQREVDPTKRAQLYQDLEKILVEQQFPVMPIYVYVTKGMLSESVCGWYRNLRDQHPLKYVWLEE